MSGTHSRNFVKWQKKRGVRGARPKLHVQSAHAVHVQVPFTLSPASTTPSAMSLTTEFFVGSSRAGHQYRQHQHRRICFGEGQAQDGGVRGWLHVVNPRQTRADCAISLVPRGQATAAVGEGKQKHDKVVWTIAERSCEEKN